MIQWVLIIIGFNTLSGSKVLMAQVYYRESYDGGKTWNSWEKDSDYTLRTLNNGNIVCAEVTLKKV